MIKIISGWLLVAFFLTAVSPAHAQPVKVPRIGILSLERHCIVG